MRKQLSILIPTYNGDPRPMVAELQRQAELVAGLDYEILVIDDGSPDQSCVASCWQIAKRPHCRFMALEQNIGRARIRNLLASLARREWLLFLDCDMSITDDRFLLRYLEADDQSLVVDGGVSIGPGEPGNLRWMYETASASAHTAEKRRQQPYQDFHTANFMVRRDTMTAHPFDDRFRHYGYEDVFFGKQLRQAGIGILHIDNPAGFNTFEDNAHFVSKTEEGLRTLYAFRDELRGYSQLLTFVDGIHVGAVRWSIRLWHRLAGRFERRNLCGRKPSLRLFKLYKLGYFLTLTKTTKQL